jgi:hypothetical protein
MTDPKTLWEEERAKRDKCKHIYSYHEGFDEGWLSTTPADEEYLITKFKYCPLCGEQLMTPVDELIQKKPKTLVEVLFPGGDIPPND